LAVGGELVLSALFRNIGALLRFVERNMDRIILACIVLLAFLGLLLVWALIDLARLGWG